MSEIMPIVYEIAASIFTGFFVVQVLFGFRKSKPKERRHYYVQTNDLEPTTIE